MEHIMTTQDIITFSIIWMIGGIYYFGMTFLFIVLKLTSHITWSWWWVLSPLWLGFILFFIICGIFIIGYKQ